MKWLITILLKAQQMGPLYKILRGNIDQLLTTPQILIKSYI